MSMKQKSLFFSFLAAAQTATSMCQVLPSDFGTPDVHVEIATSIAGVASEMLRKLQFLRDLLLGGLREEALPNGDKKLHKSSETTNESLSEAQLIVKELVESGATTLDGLAHRAMLSASFDISPFTNQIALELRNVLSIVEALPALDSQLLSFALGEIRERVELLSSLLFSLKENAEAFLALISENQNDFFFVDPTPEDLHKKARKATQKLLKQLEFLHSLLSNVTFLAGMLGEQIANVASGVLERIEKFRERTGKVLERDSLTELCVDSLEEHIRALGAAGKYAHREHDLLRALDTLLNPSSDFSAVRQISEVLQRLEQEDETQDSGRSFSTISHKKPTGRISFPGKPSGRHEKDTGSESSEMGTDSAMDTTSESDSGSEDSGFTDESNWTRIL